MIRVVLVADQELVREGIKVLCEGEGDIEVASADCRRSVSTGRTSC